MLIVFQYPQTFGSNLLKGGAFYLICIFIIFTMLFCYIPIVINDESAIAQQTVGRSLNHICKILAVKTACTQRIIGSHIHQYRPRGLFRQLCIHLIESIVVRVIGVAARSHPGKSRQHKSH